MKRSTIFRLKVAGMAFVLCGILVQVANTAQMPQGGQQAPASGSRFPSMSSLNPFASRPPAAPGGQQQSGAFSSMASMAQGMMPPGMRSQAGQGAPAGQPQSGGFNPIGMISQGMRPQGASVSQGMPNVPQGYAMPQMPRLPQMPSMPQMPLGVMPQMGGGVDLSKVMAEIATLKSMINGLFQKADVIIQKEDNTAQILGQIMQMEQADMQSDARLSETVQEIAADVDALAADVGTGDTGEYAQQPSGGQAQQGQGGYMPQAGSQLAQQTSQR